MEVTQTTDAGFESLWASLKELDKSQKENSRIFMKNAKLIRKLGGYFNKHSDTQCIVRQLETMCYL
ncbi:MAG: hypothetical protein FWF55_00385 [Treponema sp.]|nr:hypothetical protein [Treponema sp.]